MARRRSALISAASIVFASAAGSAAPPRRNAQFAALEARLDSAVTQAGMPSAIAIVFDRNRILWSHASGFADTASKRRPTLDTRYRLGSMAKAVTSTVLAIAVERGTLSWESKLVVDGGGAPRTITVRQAVNMAAGIAQAVCYQGISGAPDPLCGARFDEQFARVVTDGDGRYSYSNMGPQLAANRLSRQVGRPFAQIARQLLFRPTGMRNMTFGPARSAAERAISYDTGGRPYDHAFVILPPAGAGLEASATDIVRFGQLHLSGKLPGGRRLLSRRGSLRFTLHRPVASTATAGGASGPERRPNF
jgi:CubicO group peptidase (beta-lactamase class C family)